MSVSGSTKRCRKRIEGYSEIVERVPGSDSLSDIFRTESNCISCKCLILSMIIITIGATLIGSLLLIELQKTTISQRQVIGTYEPNSTNQTARSNGTSIYNTLDRADATETIFGPLHNRKKRNTSNETESTENNYNSKLREYFNNIYQKLDDFKSATDKLYEELQSYWSTVPQTRVSSRSSEQTIKSEDNSVLRNASSFSAESQINRSRRDPEKHEVTESEEHVISSMPVATSAGQEHVEANTAERISSTPDQANVSTGVTSGTDQTERFDLNTTERTDATMPNTGTSPTSSKSENHLENDSSKRDVTSTTEITVSRYPDSKNSDGDDGTANDDISTSPINKIEYSYSMTTTRDEPVEQPNPTQFDKSEMDQNSTNQHELDTMEIQFSPSTPPNESDSSVSYLVDGTTRGNIMKIPPRSTSPPTEITAVVPEEIRTTDDFPSFLDTNTPDLGEEQPISEPTLPIEKEIEVAEINEKYNVLFKELIDNIKKSKSTTYLLNNIPENASLNGIVNIITERLKQSRSYRHADNSDPPWYMLCYQKVIKQDGGIDMKFVKVPLNQSEIQKIPLTHRYGENDWPLYSAHSLDTHQLYQANLTNNQTVGNAVNQIEEVIMFPSDDNSTLAENAKGSKYYCSYSHDRAASETENSLESQIKLLLTSTDKILNDVENQLCADDEKMCQNGKQCIKASLWCDQRIHCTDRSDENSCSCRDLVNEDKLCDGYLDCPNGEDEQECFDCSKNEFSCNDFKRGENDDVVSTCIPMEMRCDGTPDCPNVKDEKDCELLSDKILLNETLLVSYFEGYLHRNWKGKWYPVCNDIHQKLAVKACESELGIRNIRDVKTELVEITSNLYNGKFVTVQEDGQHIVIDQCDPANTYIRVKCPTEYCGSPINSESIPKYKYKREVRSNHMTEQEILDALREIIVKMKTDLLIRNRRWDNEEARVVGGETSKPGAWPWIAALYRSGIFHCGAMILDDTWLLSAAHCVGNYHEFYYEIQTGILRRFSYSPMQQIRKVTHVIQHELYNRTDMKNDIALLRVDPPLKLNRWIQATCLPEARPPWGPPPGDFCTAVGWGATQEHGSDPDSMMEVQVPILPVCKHRPDVEGHEICAGYAEGLRDTCQGDSGGPLLCRIPANRDRWYVSGIVSHGEGCARRMEPGVYTRIAIHLRWILDTIENFSSPQRFPQPQQPKLKCPGMTCSDGQCIAPRRICDKVLDCMQGEDELNVECEKEWSDFSRSGSKDFVGHQAPIHTHRSINNYTHLKNGSEFNYWQHIDLHSSNLEPTFVCKIINQTIPEKWLCDDEMDCEDGTDEINCICVDILKKINPSLICNSIPDCHDWSDEKNCTKQNCTENEFMCHRSYTCTNRSNVCDGKLDCPAGEDEQHCYALSKDLDVELDYFNIPTYKESGITMQNMNGTWKPYCVLENKKQIINQEKHKICHKLGFKIIHSNPDTECFMIANLTEPVVIRIIPHKDCWDDEICPYGPANKTQFCSIYNRNYTFSPLICLAPRGFWRLTAYNNEKFDEFCSTNAKEFSMQLWSDPKILTDNDFKPLPLLNCSGYRCSLGKCISLLELCDGKSDCRNNEDEMPEKCSKLCKLHSFKCKNNQCIDVNLICDGNDDCGDGSDEPLACSNFNCATYLNMTKPWKLCDSHADCWDKSDENSVTCPFHCNSTSHFKCHKSNECIPKEFICNGESDCSEGEDESECLIIDQKEKDENKPNLLQRSHGEWHKACLKTDLIDVSLEVICKKSNLLVDRKGYLVKLIPGNEIPTNEYTKVVLRNKIEFKLSAKPLLEPNMTEICYNVHLKCH